MGGNFTSIGGMARNRIAKLNKTDGSADTAWNPNASSYVETIAIDGSNIYAGGRFTEIGGLTRNRIAQLNKTDGSADTAWNPNVSGSVNTLVIDGTDIYAGGWFEKIGDIPQFHFALFKNAAIPIEEEEEVEITPKDYFLSQNYPNPFNPVTTIKFELPVASFVTLKVYNILGEEVAVLANGQMEAGYKEVKFHSNALATGVYIYRLEAGDYISVKKMMLLK